MFHESRDENGQLIIGNEPEDAIFVETIGESVSKNIPSQKIHCARATCSDPDQLILVTGVQRAPQKLKRRFVLTLKALETVLLHHVLYSAFYGPQWRPHGGGVGVDYGNRRANRSHEGGIARE
jgi:hypothetical protein